MVLDTAKTEEQKEYHLAWNAWKRCCKKVDAQGEQTFFRYSRSISQRSSLSCITTRNRMDRTKVQRDGRTCKRKPHKYHLSTEEFKRYQGQWYLTLNKSGKNGPMQLRPDFRAAISLSKTVSTASQANKLQNPFLHHNLGYGILLQAHRGGTRLIGVGEAFKTILSDLFLLQLVSFTVDGDPL